MREEEIKDWQGRPVAFYLYLDNGDIELHEFPSRQPVALYEKMYDRTIEIPSRQPVARGNVLAMFITMKK